MKKFRLFRLILALVTVVAGIYMIYANVSVRGFNLLSMDSSAGHQVAVTYRWSILVFVLLLAANIGIALIRRARMRETVCLSGVRNVSWNKR